MTTPVTPLDQSELATQIVVEGFPFQLKGITAERALNPQDGLKTKLPDEYKKLSNGYTQFAKNRRAAIHIDLQGKDFNEAWQEYIKAKRDPQGKLVEKDKPYLTQLAELFDPLLPKGGPVGKALGKGYDTISDLMSGGIDGVNEGWALPFKLMSAGGRGAQDAWRSFASGLTDEQAETFGVALAGSAYYEARERHGQTTGQVFRNNPITGIKAGFEHITTEVPYLSDFWAEVRAAFFFAVEFVTHMFKDGPTRSWAEFRQQEYAKLEGARGQTYAQRLNNTLAAQEFPQAAARVSAAENVAGAPTRDLVGTLVNGTPYSNGQGQIATADIRGKETLVPGRDGKPVTRMEVAQGRFEGIWEGYKAKLAEHGITGQGGMIGATAVGFAIPGVAAAWGGREIARGAVDGYQNAPLHRSQAHEAHATDLTKKLQTVSANRKAPAWTGRTLSEHATQAENAALSELEKHEARTGKISGPNQPRPGLLSRAWHHMKNPMQALGKVIGRGADEITTTASAMKGIFVGGEKLAAAKTLVPRVGMPLVVLGSVIEDGGSLWDNGKNRDVEGMAVDVSRMAGTVGGTVAGTVGGMWTGGNIGQGIGMVVGGIGGALVGVWAGGVGAVPGAIAGAAMLGSSGRVAGTAIGGLVGSGVGGTLGHKALGGTVAAVVDYKPPTEVAPEVQPFTQEEMRAMIEGHAGGSEQIRAAREACQKMDSKALLKFPSDKRIGFASCESISIGSPSTPSAAGGGKARTHAAQPAPVS